MIKTNKTPSIVEFIKTLTRSSLLDVHTCIPGKIKEYDESKQKASVAPLLKKNGRMLMEHYQIFLY